MADQGHQNQLVAIIEQGWREIKTGAIDRLESYLLTGNSDVMFSKKEYMKYYAIVYNLCTVKYDRAQEILYNKFSESIRRFLEVHVKKDLESLQGAELLQKLTTKWADHQIMVKWMRTFF